MTTGPRIKICGITRVGDAQAVVAAGADALGLVFADSPRRVGLAAATTIAESVAGSGVRRIGVFVDPQPQEVSRVLERVPIDVLHFHGGEPATPCCHCDLPYLKAVRVRKSFAIAALQAAD